MINRLIVSIIRRSSLAMDRFKYKSETNSVRNKEAIIRFPSFDDKLYEILEALKIELSIKEYSRILSMGQRAIDIIDSASLLKDAGILSKSRYDQLNSHEEIKEIKEIFNSLNLIQSLTEHNTDLIIDCRNAFDRHYIHTLIIIKNENPELVTDKIFETLLTHVNKRLICNALNSRSSKPFIIKALCTLTTESLLTEPVLSALLVGDNPEKFAQDLKTAKCIAATYRYNKLKSGFFSCSSKSSIKIIAELEQFSSTGNYSLFQKSKTEKPGKRLQTILNAGDTEITFRKMTQP